MDDDYGARVRAARCYAEKDLADLASKMGISKRTLERIESGYRPLTLPEARTVARECGVPFLFLSEGFRLYEEAERAFREPGRAPKRGRLPKPLGALGQSLEDDRTTPGDPPQTQPPEEEERRRGDVG